MTKCLHFGLARKGQREISVLGCLIPVYFFKQFMVNIEKGRLLIVYMLRVSKEKVSEMRLHPENEWYHAVVA